MNTFQKETIFLYTPKKEFTTVINLKNAYFVLKVLLMEPTATTNLSNGIVNVLMELLNSLWSSHVIV